MGYIRNIGDGPYFYQWQRLIIYPERDRKIMLLLNYENHLTDGRHNNEPKPLPRICTVNGRRFINVRGNRGNGAIEDHKHKSHVTPYGCRYNRPVDNAGLSQPTCEYAFPIRRAALQHPAFLRRGRKDRKIKADSYAVD